jgi:hypothetical protein
MIEGHDMSTCNKVEIHYINMGPGNRRNPGVYEVKDLQVAADSDDHVMFTWLVSKNATSLVGSLNFSIRLACMNGFKVEYSWRTGIYSGIPVIESYDNSAVIVEQYADILQDWYMELLMTGTEGINIVEAATNEAIERIKNVDYVVEIEQETIDRIEAAGEAKKKELEQYELHEHTNKAVLDKITSTKIDKWDRSVSVNVMDETLIFS